MEWLDGLATSIGDGTCRYLANHGHEGLEGLICSDGAYSAGWKIFAITIGLVVLGVVLTRLLRPIA